MREIPQPPERKTKRWVIAADDGEIGLGEVKWLGRWRCYAYFPLYETVYEKQCLRDIADFCEKKTKEKREAHADPQTKGESDADQEGK